MGTQKSVIDWLLDSDPSIRWQVKRDLIDAPAEEVATERARIAVEGIGARLLAQQRDDGSWAGEAWNRGWDRDGTWRGMEWQGVPFFAGEVEPCINGQVAASGAYFGQDVQRIIDRLLGEQLPDGGWNCEAGNGSTRASFNTTICVLEALLEHELAGRWLLEIGIPAKWRSSLTRARAGRTGG